jgi:hypothetical protein
VFQEVARMMLDLFGDQTPASESLREDP